MTSRVRMLRGCTQVMLCTLLAMMLLCLAGCASAAVVDDASPHMVDAIISAGSELTESSQYVEVRLAFDAPLEATGNVRDGLAVLVDGEEPDARTMQVSAEVEGQDVVVRLTPTAAADGSSSSTYFALYEGLVSVAPKAADGGIPQVRVQGGTSNAVAEEATFTVPTGFAVAEVSAQPGSAAEGVPASVDFTVTEFAQLRCCTWFDFGTGPIYMHNHEFLRDLPSTAAARLAQTVNARCADQLVAEADGAQVRIQAANVTDGQLLGVEILEGPGVDPVGAGAAVPDMGGGEGAQ